MTSEGMKTQRFTVVLATDGDVTESELDGVFTALGYHGVMVVAAETRDSHEHPCPSEGCIDKLRKDGHDIPGDVVCCICWATGSEEATKLDDYGIVGVEGDDRRGGDESQVRGSDAGSGNRDAGQRGSGASVPRHELVGDPGDRCPADRAPASQGDCGNAEHGGVIDDYPIVGYVEAGEEKVEHPC